MPNIKEIRQKLEAQKAQEQYDDPGAAPGPVSDTIQGTVNRLVTAIDKAAAIKDLTHLTTQDEIYNAVEANKGGYKVKIGGIEYLTSNVAYTKTLAEFTINAMTSGQQQNEFILVNKGNTGVPLKQLARTFTGEPTDDKHATTKKYVDAKETTITTAYKAADTAITNAYKSADSAILNSANAHSNSLLSTSMVVTFDDGTTGYYKVGH